MAVPREHIAKVLSRVLEGRAGLRYAIHFGSSARGDDHALSDVDVAVRGLSGMARLDLAADLEAALGQTVQVVALEGATVTLAYRIFRDGVVVAEPDRACRIAEQCRAVVLYLDHRPIERLAVHGVLEAARRGARSSAALGRATP